MKENVKELHNKMVKGMMGVFNTLYDCIKSLINENGGFINTSSGGDIIYSLEFLNNGDAKEFVIMGLRVVEDRVEFYSEPSEFAFEMTDEEILNGEDTEWLDLINIEGYYIQTLYNIFEGIISYI